MRVLLLVLALFAAAACAPAPAPPVGGAVAPVGFNGTDTAWLQLTISMTERAATLLDLAPDHAAKPEVRALAATLRADRERDLTRLRALRAEAGLPDADVHAGHPMPGMVTDASLVLMRATRGPEFDTAMVSLIGAHLDQSVKLARGEIASGEHAGTREVAEELERESAADRALLDRVG